MATTPTQIARPTTTLIPRTVGNINTVATNCCSISGKLKEIHNQLRGIETILRSSSLLSNRASEGQRRNREFEARRTREINQEKGKKQNYNLSLPSPDGGLFQGITQFIYMNLLAFATPKILELQPHISTVIRGVIVLSKFVSSFTTELFKNIVRSINFGYKVYDKTKQIVKNIGGENFVKVFDETSSLLNKFFNFAIIVGLAVAGSGSVSNPFDPRNRRGRRGGGGERGGGGRRGGGRAGGPLVTSGEDVRNPFRQRPGVTSSEDIRNPLRPRPGVTASAETKLATTGLKKVLGKIEIVGPIIGFVIDLMMGEPVGRAAAGAVGSAIGIGIGAALVGSGTFGIGAVLGGAIGGWLGDLIGTSLYDTVAPMFGWQVATQAQGGAVGGNASSANVPTRRTNTRTRPTVKRFNRVQPGRNVGGESSIKKLYPDPSDDKQTNPYKTLVRTSEILKKNSFSALMAAGVDLALGQQVDKSIFRNFADQLNYIVESSYDPNSPYGSQSINKQILTAASGGKITTSRTGGMQRSNLSDQLYDSMVSMMNVKSGDIFSEIRRNLSLTGAEETSVTSPGGGGVNGGGSPNLIGHRNAKIVYDYLTKDLGFTSEAASGILGNMLQESGGIDPKQNQQKGGAAKGIIQWEPPRWGRLLNWANTKNKDPYDLKTQLEWMVIEMKERGTYGRIKNLRDVRRAVDLFEHDMENAGVPMMEKRYAYAANAYASFVTKSGIEFGLSGRTHMNDPNWAHAHFQALPGGTIDDVIQDVIPIVKKLANDGVEVQLTDGTRVLPGKNDKYYEDILRNAYRQHKKGNIALDINVPKGTKVPVPLRDYRKSDDNIGNNAIIPGTGKTMVGHLKDPGPNSTSRQNPDSRVDGARPGSGNDNASIATPQHENIAAKIVPPDVASKSTSLAYNSYPKDNNGIGFIQPIIINQPVGLA